MKLKDHINKAIKKYPTLFKAGNYKKSTVSVLNHLFLVIGNGYEWHDGYLCDGELKPYGKEKYNSLSRDFFKKRYYSYNRTHKYMYEAIKKKPELFSDVIGETTIVKKSNNYYYQYGKDIIGYKFSPYPICQYSAILTMPDDVRKDWLKGAIKIVNLSIEYFNDTKQYKNNCYYSHKRRINAITYDFNKLTKEGRFEEVAVKIWGANLEDENNPEEYVRKFWKNHKKEQLKYLQDFLKKWKERE